MTKINLSRIVFALILSMGLNAIAGSLGPTTNLTVFQDDWRKERDQLRADLNKRIEKNKKAIQSLKDDTRNKKDESSVKYNAAAADLEKRNNRLQKSWMSIMMIQKNAGKVLSGSFITTWMNLELL